MIAELQSRDRSHLSFIRGSVYAALRSVRAAGWLCASYVVDVVARACIEFNIRCVGVFASVSARLPVMAGEGRGVDSQRRDGGDHALSRRAMCLSLFRVLTVLDYTPLS